MNYKFILFCFFFTLSLSQNLHPIILIHGFLGWGRDEMAGYYYWGGLKDYQKNLQNKGYTVYTVSVGPISSNRDRAIEAFYQIKGGQVDYGQSHSDSLGTIQRPKSKNYSGLYSNWSGENPIHVIGHSQGGQTARMLEMLLKDKDSTETSLLLSNSYNGWIKSITTISTPHNGSTLVPIMLDTFPFTLSLAPWFGSIENKILQNFYSFDLEQWGLTRTEDETFIDFWSRLSKSKLANTKNLCAWDLSPTGAKEFNDIYVEDNNVYYFSFITTATKPKQNSPHHSPSKNMSIHLWPTALLMGSYNHAPNSKWFENDGIVNSVSMSHPHTSNVVELTNPPKKGIWQTCRVLNLDHQAIIGHNVPQSKHKEILAIYNKHCNLLWSLK